jgi:hypothetical protein
MFHRRDRHDHPFNWPFFFPAGEKIEIFWPIFSNNEEQKMISRLLLLFEMDANLSRSRATINQKTAERYISTFSSFSFSRRRRCETHLDKKIR